MKKYPTCKTCGEKMNIYDGNASGQGNYFCECNIDTTQQLAYTILNRTAGR